MVGIVNEFPFGEGVRVTSSQPLPFSKGKGLWTLFFLLPSYSDSSLSRTSRKMPRSPRLAGSYEKRRMMQAMRTRSDSTGKNWVKRGLNLHLTLFFCQKCCKPVSNIYSGSRVSSSNKAIVGVDYLGADILNSACRILQC